jgi:type I restriction enzyme R subunit
MANIGDIERKTQQRIVGLFKDTLGYRYLGNWEEREGNSNIEEEPLRRFLCEKMKYDDALVDRALYQFRKTADNTSQRLYDRNREVYEALRYGVNVSPEVGEHKRDVYLIDWKNPENNDFAVAEEVAVVAADAKAHGKRPDIVLYVNGIALAVLELKRSTVSVSEGIRQNLDNQRREFIQPFFSTVQLVMAGNDTQGLRYGTIETPEKYYLTWKEESGIESPLDAGLVQLCSKARLLELVHDFIVFDAGVKKLCRHNQYFGVKAAQGRVLRREGGIIWHTQGSGKSLTMVWLAKWIREAVPDSRVLIITDRTELDRNIEKVFLGVSEKIHRTKSGADLIAVLNDTAPWLVCSLIHKFGGKEEGEAVGDIAAYIDDLRRALPKGFRAKGNLFVFVDECHRTQSGDLHTAMKAILPTAMFIGFTGTPLLKADKRRSIEVFGPYIHTYKFDEAVKDGVVLDLQYEARSIDQSLTSQENVDKLFEAKTAGLSDFAKAKLKERWGTLQKILSSQSRLEKIVADIMMDMALRPRLMTSRGNAMLIAGSIYEACRLYELFSRTELAGKCAVVTSYRPLIADIKGEETGEGQTEKRRKYDIYKRMLADWFDEPTEKAVNRVEEFEKAVTEKFVNEPARMKLLVVVDKLLTGFDAPPATYLYIDKKMHDHGLFQAICRVNRLDGDDKDFGYIVDYKDLFHSLEGAVNDYTSGAFDDYDPEDVIDLIKERHANAREHLEEIREELRALCEPVEPPRDQRAHFRYFCAEDSGDTEQLKTNQPKRVRLYKLSAALVRAYADIANEMAEAGYSTAESAQVEKEVAHFEALSSEVKLNSADYIDFKMYEPAMRYLIDTYVRAEEAERISAFDDVPLVQLIVERGEGAVEALPKGIRNNKNAAAETIENNVRRLIVDETPINPKYFERMSQLLDELIHKRRADALDYQEYLKQIVALARKVTDPRTGASYPKSLDTGAKRALYDNLGQSETLALAVDRAVSESRQDDWRSNAFKIRKVKNAISGALYTARAGAPDVRAGRVAEESAPYGADERESVEDLIEKVLELVKNQNEY